ncbi:MAG: TPM domain-containing protein [Candidatus Limnocylindria bacterium]
MHRWRPSRRRWLPLTAGVLLAGGTAAAVSAAGPPFPDPVFDQAVYDEAELLSPTVEAALEERIDAIETRSGAEIVIYTEHYTDLSGDENLSNAAALMDQWGIGRSGFDDGLVILIAKDPDPGETIVSTYAGAGFIGAYANEEALAQIREDELVPLAREGNWDGALLATIDALGERVTPTSTGWLNMLRVANSALGLIGAPLALIVTIGTAWRRWKREGDDPDLIDSPSILMAGPPAEMTPALATVVREGRATQHSLNTALVELAASGRIAFHNLDQVREVKSDDDPDPLTDPAIEVRHEPTDADELAGPQAQAWDTIQRLDLGAGVLSRERLWSLNGALGPVKKVLEEQAVRLGWLARLPTPTINRMSTVGLGEALLGGGAIWLGISMPMSGAVIFGGALVLGGVGTLGFGQAMSQRTKPGAYVDAMLKAYRRTLELTLKQARNMGEVVAEPTVRMLADTPDKAVVWGIALGLHDEVAEVLARGLNDYRASGGTAGSTYYPVWLGSSSSSSWTDAGLASPGRVVEGSGSIFSSSALPDIGGMFDALGSIGSSPSSSSGGGGGFGGGGSGGGGGGSSSV